ncbi:MAG: hypothetical protein A3G21_03600 [Acidobacteria bacterium RIFCSPLOWO2_12_FULL_66_21]|nr:MAG: hypothetical protein A3G21_03600 [Acidobacteria bacterium RIFCSPLOWO2_12_FULL_66_21]
MFFVRRPSTDAIDRFLSDSQELPLSYGPIGIVREKPAGHFDEIISVIGHGTIDFERARAALIAWKQFDIGWTELHPSGASIEPGTTIAVLIRHLGFWSLNGGRVIYTVGERDRGTHFGFAYGTLVNHSESGEELFEAFLDPETDAVMYHIRAVSWPQATLARVGQPIVRLLQARFRRHSAAAMERATSLNARAGVKSTRGCCMVALLVLALIAQPGLLSAHSLTGTTPNVARLRQTAEPTQKGNGIIAGVVVNERQEPVAGAVVQAFSVDPTVRPVPSRGTVPPLTRASGSASTDAEGRFRISGLPLGEYRIAASPLFPSGGPAPAQIYGMTLYPSTVDERQAVSVSALASPAAGIQIQLVPVRGVRVSGSVVSPSAGPTAGLAVRLFQRLGGFGTESALAAVGDNGTFEIPRVPPGRYRLTIRQATSRSGMDSGEFATTVFEVHDREADDLSLVLGPGASISGRVVAEPGTSVPTAVGLRVSASPTAEQYSASIPVTARVTAEWSFRMAGLSGSYEFTVSADRAPAVRATRITVDGVQAAAGAEVALTDGAHEVVVFVAPREPPRPTVDRTVSVGALVERFKAEKVLWRQLEIAKAIVEYHDASVLPSLVDWLGHTDRHIRGNVAFIFGGLGDPRGFQIIAEILTDRSDRPEGQGVPTASSDGRYHVARQIAADRYYAAHLLGDLRDPRAIPVLVPLLKDTEVNAIVPWALGEIGDKRAIGPLLEALDDESPTVRVLAIYALETLHATEALPRLISLLNDHRKSNFGAQVSVADAAKAAIATLQ